ncbi:phage tail protein [Streptomyces sp. NPDC059193]|uniref:phage tail protein n=1 Tax=Streptomyces sp. NPDC059193 TaxID=3346763 RepID=UPI0036C40764
MSDFSELALSANFTLTFPHAEKKDPIGRFTGLEGLSLWMEGDELYAGGDNESSHYLPTRMKYKPLVVSRPPCDATPAVCQWVIDNMKNPQPRTGEVRIYMQDPTSPMFVIEFYDLVPVAWRGPKLTTDGLIVASEEIEFVHRGFKFVPKTSKTA